MMLFVANIGSTMAKMFAFVFRRIMMIFCCRMSARKKRALAQKNRQKLAEKSSVGNTIVIDEKPPIPIKSNLTPIEDTDEPIEQSASSPTTAEQTHPQSSTSLTNSTTDVRQLPANVRLNMLTGMTNSSTSRSLTSSSGSVADRSKDAIGRINDLIRQDSLQRFDNERSEEDQQQQQQQQRRRRRSAEVSPIEYYINETKKLTTNLESPKHSQSLASMDKSGQEGTTAVTPADEENNMKQVKVHCRLRFSFSLFSRVTIYLRGKSMTFASLMFIYRSFLPRIRRLSTMSQRRKDRRRRFSSDLNLNRLTIDRRRKNRRSSKAVRRLRTTKTRTKRVVHLLRNQRADDSSHAIRVNWRNKPL